MCLCSFLAELRFLSGELYQECCIRRALCHKDDDGVPVAGQMDPPYSNLPNLQPLLKGACSQDSVPQDRGQGASEDSGGLCDPPHPPDYKLLRSPAGKWEPFWQVDTAKFTKMAVAGLGRQSYTTGSRNNFTCFRKCCWMTAYIGESVQPLVISNSGSRTNLQ